MSVNEHAEPVAGNSQMPVGVMIILTLLGYIGCTKVDQLNANFAANVPFPDAEVPSTATIIHLSPYLMELGIVNLQPICVISS